MRTLNESACAALLEGVNWDDTYAIASVTVLAAINAEVIVGNCFVIAAVFCSSKLRSVTNLFIVSLAVADLLVGLAILPFSATREVFNVWIFGDIWCSVWLAVDVWMCTASILNLCAISLDRYVAVTRPVTYPSIMSRKRAKILIAGLWILSFVICFPPLVGWRDKTELKAVTYTEGNQTLVAYSTEAPLPPCPWICELTNDAGYVVYSALGSFYIPMFVMLFFYWRIYRAAVRTTKAINRGFKTTKGAKGMGNRYDDNRLTLRIHRGRGSGVKNAHGSPHSNGSNHSTTTSIGSGSPPRIRRHSSARRSQERVRINISYASTERLSTGADTTRSPSPSSTYAVHYTTGDSKEPSDKLLRPNSQSKRRRRGSVDSGITEREMSPSTSQNVFEDLDNRPKRRMGKRNIKAQVKRFRMETKAAKTLGIIVGGFIVCWLPFFTMYLVRTFCEDCINPLLFSILFWLGYCNSAINPLIYALFSKDFRFAFKRILCRCLCISIGRRGSGGSQMKSCKSPNISTRGKANNSLGDDSDQMLEASESR